MVAKADMAITIRKPYGFPAPGTGTFIPQKLANMVGIERIIVIAAKNSQFS